MGLRDKDIQLGVEPFPCGCEGIGSIRGCGDVESGEPPVQDPVVSVPTNIAEGSKRQSNTDYARFLNMAESSLAETEYLLMLGRDLGQLTPSAAESLLTDVSDIARMLHALRAKVEQGG